MNNFIQTLLWLIPGLPLFGAGLCALFAGEDNEGPVSVVACTAAGGSFVAGLVSFLYLTRIDGHALTNTLWTWMAIDPLQIDFTLVLDPLSGIMVLVITGVGFLIHLYSIGYMHDDPGFPRYFAFLNLFLGMMTWLVLAGDLVMMFIGWEGVAFCSWGLIGFWFTEDVKAEAGNKAFLVNRIGDFAFLIGMFLLFWTQYRAGAAAPSLAFETLTDPAHLDTYLAGTTTAWGLPVPLVGALCLFLGATGKSAQIPLYVWLPDAMEGPTPVSALIHAATMVTAGVYLVCRLHPLFELSAVAMNVVAAVGAATLLTAALFACFEMDFKKILAYSTISQLGYMFLGVGVGAYAAGMFHLVTHAFFKALLFLCSGAVLHAMHNVGDIREMGGLRRKMPVTFWTFVIAALALVGIPPFAGFWSKDEIFWYTFAGSNGSTLLWTIGLLGVLLTSFYTFRLLFVAFTGSARMDNPDNVHEAGGWMLTPMVLLAVLSLGGGVIGIPEFVSGGAFPNLIEHQLHGVFKHPAPNVTVDGHGTQWVLMGVTVSVGGVGFLVAWLTYGLYGVVPGSDETVRSNTLRRPLQDKLYVDEAGYHGIVRPVLNAAHIIHDDLETIFLDTLVVNGSGLSVRISSWIYSLFQNGRISRYIFWIWVGFGLVLYLMMP